MYTNFNSFSEEGQCGVVVSVKLVSGRLGFEYPLCYGSLLDDCHRANQMLRMGRELGKHSLKMTGVSIREYGSLGVESKVKRIYD